MGIWLITAWLKFKSCLIAIGAGVAAIIGIYFYGKRSGSLGEMQRQAEVDNENARKIEDAADNARQNRVDNIDDAVSELPADNRPSFEAWLSANQDDPLYSVHFNRLNQASATAEETMAASAPAPDMSSDDQLLDRLRAALTGNPDAGVSQPRDHKNKEWTADEIRKLRAKNKPQGSSRGRLPNSELQQILSEWRSKGMIK